MLRRCLQYLLDRIPGSREIAALCRDERLEVVGASILLRYLTYRVDLCRCRVVVAFCDQHRCKLVARRQIVRHGVDRFLQNGQRLVRLVLDPQKPRFHEIRFDRDRRTREHVVDDLRRSGDVAPAGAQRRQSEKRLRKIRLGLHVDGCVVAAPAVRVHGRGQVVGHGPHGVRGGVDEAEEARVRVAHRPRHHVLAHEGEDLLERAALLRQRLVEERGVSADLAEHRMRQEVAAVEQRRSEQITRFGVVRRFLQHIAQLDHRGIGVALGEIFLRRFDKALRVLAAAGEQCDRDGQCRPGFGECFHAHRSWDLAFCDRCVCHFSPNRCMSS